MIYIYIDLINNMLFIQLMNPTLLYVMFNALHVVNNNYIFSFSFYFYMNMVQDYLNQYNKQVSSKSNQNVVWLD